MIVSASIWGGEAGKIRTFTPRKRLLAVFKTAAFPVRLTAPDISPSIPRCHQDFGYQPIQSGTQTVFDIAWTYCSDHIAHQQRDSNPHRYCCIHANQPLSHLLSYVGDIKRSVPKHAPKQCIVMLRGLPAFSGVPPETYFPAQRPAFWQAPHESYQPATWWRQLSSFFRLQPVSPQQCT